MDRRHFLKMGGFVTASAATLGLAGCGGNDSPANLPAGLPEAPAATGASYKFPQSIASGDPRPDSIMLWSRVVPSGADDVNIAAAASNFSVKLQVTEADNSASLGSNKALTGTMVADTSVPCYAQYDNTLRHKLSGLAAGKTYYYQFIAGDVRSNVGRFKTAPAKDADIAKLKFAYMTCQDWSVNHWGAYSHLVANDGDIDFFVHLGDYIYETVGEAFQTGAVEALHGGTNALSLPDGTFKNGKDGAKYATTLADYRYLYKKYRTDKRLQAAHERFAMIAIWDDHEFSDDCWNDAQTYDNGTFNATTLVGDNTHQATRRRIANQAWYEFMPADIWYSESAADTYFNVKIYRELQFGKLAHLVMTDERLYRADHLIPEAAPNPATGKEIGSIGSRYMVPETSLAAVEAAKIKAMEGRPDPLLLVSILGTEQRNWWKNTMKGSTATWKLWGNEVSLLKMGVDGANAIATLFALNFVPTVANNIKNTAPAAGNNNAVATAIVGAVIAGATSATAGAGATAIATSAATGGSLVAQIGAGMAAGLTQAQAGLAATAFGSVAAAAGAGATATQQQQAGALKIGELITAQTGFAAVFAAIKADIVAKKQDSSFVPADKKATVAAFAQKFLLNADQWDGYNGERKDLMKHLLDNSIKNVVALTGDIHAFYAGAVQDDYSAATPKPVMVDLVTAGVSSDSFFSYLKAAVGSLSADLATLIYFTIDIPLTGALASLGSLTVDINLLDHTLRASAVTPASLASSLSVRIRKALVDKGALSVLGTEAVLDTVVPAVVAGLAADATFASSAVALAQSLASLNSNPWLAHADTEAQGYAVVTATPASLTCEFRQVNKLVGTTAAPTAPTVIIAKTKTATVQKDVAAVVMS